MGRPRSKGISPKVPGTRLSRFRFPDLLSGHIDNQLTTQLECAACLLNIVSLYNEGSSLASSIPSSGNIVTESSGVDEGNIGNVDLIIDVAHSFRSPPSNDPNSSKNDANSTFSSSTSAVVQYERISVIDSCKLHLFHESCLYKWSLRDTSCPLCRTRFELVGTYSITPATTTTESQDGDNLSKDVGCAHRWAGMEGELKDTRKVKAVFLEDVVDAEEADEYDAGADSNVQPQSGTSPTSANNSRESLARQASSVADNLVRDLQCTIRQDRMIATANRSGRGRGCGMDPSRVKAIIERNIGRLPQAIDDPTIFGAPGGSCSGRSNTFIDPCSNRAPKRLIVRPKGKLRGKPLNLGETFKLNPKYEDFKSDKKNSLGRNGRS